MRKLLPVYISILILFTFQASSQIEVGSVSHNMTPLTAGKIHEINVPVENTGPTPQSMIFNLDIESNINTSYQSSLFDISGNLGSSSFDCSFSYDNSYLYSCPSEERINLSSGANDNLTLEFEAPLGLRGGSNLLSFNLTADSKTGEIDEEAKIQGGATGKDVGEFKFDVNGSDASGEVATLESYIFGEASDKEILGRFSTNVKGHDSIRFSYGFSKSLIKHYDYSFNLYNYSSGSWEKLDVNVNEDENKVSSEISGTGYYSLYIDRRKLGVQDLVDRETNITKNVTGAKAEVMFEKLGETENISLSLPTLSEKNGVRLNGFEIMSKVNDTASFSAEMLDDLPADIDRISEDDFNSTSYAKVKTSGNETLKFKLYSFQMQSDLFNHSENVVGYRFNGEEWVKMETNLRSQGGSYYTFESETNGNSILDFGNYESNINIQELDHRKDLLDNESLTLEVPLKNEWRGTGEITINYTLNGSESEQKTVEVKGKGNKTVEFNEKDLEPGNYTITVNDMESSFEVKLRELKYRILDRLPFNNIIILYVLLGILAAIPVIAVAYWKKEKLNPYLEPAYTKIQPFIRKIPLISDKEDEEPVGDAETETGESGRQGLDLEEGSGIKEEDEVEKDAEGSQLDPGEGDLKCEECDRKFNSMEGLKMHKSKVHENTEERDGDYLCAICGECFDTSTGLNLHHKKFHED